MRLYCLWSKTMMLKRHFSFFASVRDRSPSHRIFCRAHRSPLQARLETFGDNRSVYFARGNLGLVRRDIQLIRASDTVEKFFRINVFRDHPMDESGKLLIVLNLLKL